MNYEEKVKKYRQWLVDEIHSERKDYDDSIEHEDEHTCVFTAGTSTAFDCALREFDKIFGASERSGVGENEGVKKLCRVCSEVILHVDGKCTRCRFHSFRSK